MAVDEDEDDDTSDESEDEEKGSVGKVSTAVPSAVKQRAATATTGVADASSTPSILSKTSLLRLDSFLARAEPPHPSERSCL